MYKPAMQSALEIEIDKLRKANIELIQKAQASDAQQANYQ